MLQINGKFADAVIYTNELDSGSVGLIQALCDSVLAEDSVIRVMPDVHPGKGCAVEMTMTLKNRVAPGLVGVDIGCGMEVFHIKAQRLELQQLDKVIHTKIPAGFAVRNTPHRFCEQAELEQLKCAQKIRADKALLGIGTLGGGNHFIELDKADSGYYLVIHSGSRHLGVEVERFYHEQAYQYSKAKVPYEFAYLEDELFEDYLHDMKIVQTFAQINRRAIADEIMKAMKFTEIESFSPYIITSTQRKKSCGRGQFRQRRARKSSFRSICVTAVCSVPEKETLTGIILRRMERDGLITVPTR